MSERPGQWSLLGYGSDPVPGEPTDVGEQGRHYSAVARTIASQAERLRGLTSPDEGLRGAYADELVECCSELAEHLDKIQERFEVTGRELQFYESDLSSARSETQSALDAAEAAQRTMSANEPDQRGPFAPPLSEAEQAEADQRARDYDRASDDLGDAREQAQRAMTTFNNAAEDTARKIRAASDDDMKDSTWDKVKGAVGDIAGWLDALADVLSIVGSILVVVAMFIPGLNILVLIGIALTVVALAIHTLLAATGNGSWVDVAFDVVSLATFGLGGAAATAAKTARAATMANAAQVGGSRGAAAALSRAVFNGGKGFRGGVHKLLLRTFSTKTQNAMKSAYDDAYREIMERPLMDAADTTLRSRLFAGLDSGDVATLMTDYRAIVREFGRGVVDPTHKANLFKAVAYNWTGVAADYGPRVLNPKIGDAEAWEAPFWSDVQSTFEYEFEAGSSDLEDVGTGLKLGAGSPFR